MTLGEAVEFVRRYLDESRLEYFTDIDIRNALDVAEKLLVIELVRKKHYSDVVHVEYDTGLQQATGQSVRGDWYYDLTAEPRVMLLGACYCSMNPLGFNLDIRRALYRRPSLYFDYVYPNRLLYRRRSLTYTLVGRRLYFNGSADPSDNIAKFRLVYIREPSIIISGDFTLPPHLHSDICLRAAQLCIGKTVPHMEHSGIISENGLLLPVPNKSSEQQ